MSQNVVRRLASSVAIVVFIGVGQAVFAADPPTDQSADPTPTGAALIEAQLEEAKALLAEDKASHDETARKKAEIDEKLAARKEREAQIQQELEALCEEQEKLSPGTVDDCLEKLNN